MAARDTRTRALVALGLVLLVAGVYAQTRGHSFLDYDDGEYVAENPEVLKGLTAGGVVWAFTTGHAANWHPLTWLSHMADVSLFGPSSGAHHVVNAAFHAANAVLLFLVLNVLTGALWRSAAVAALFVVHPLNVQSVAWVAERKNVLSTLFWLLAMLAYAAYARRPSRGRMAFVAVLLALGLMAKPMLVSLPLVLLVLDFWPLGRLSLDGPPREILRKARPLVVEKLPLFALSAASSGVTWLVQRRGGAAAPAETFPLLDRVANAFLSGARYLLDAVWPAALSVFYPHPGAIGGRVDYAAAVLALAALAAITWATWAAREKRPFLLAGWAWYGITLLPVIGLVQVGAQARADRYAYVPLVGVFIAVVWGGAEALERLAPSGAARVTAGCVALVAVGALAVRAHREVAHWRDATTLYRHALSLDGENWLAWNNLGSMELRKGNTGPALTCFDAALRIHRDFADAQYNRGVALQGLGRPAEAILAYERALELDPKNADAWVNLGNAHAGLGRPQKGVECYGRAMRIRPEDAHALYGLVLALDTLGDRRGAFAALERLRRVDPKMAAELFVPAAPR